MVLSVKGNIMNIKEQLKQEFESLKQAFNSLFPETAPQKFNDYKLADGTVIRTDVDLAVGAKIDVIAEDGTIAPLADGEYQVATDTGMLSINVAGGYVTEVSSPQEEATDTETPAEMAENTAPAPAMDHMAEMEQIKADIAALKDAVQQIASKLEGNMSAQDENKNLAEQVRTLTISLEKMQELNKASFNLIEKIGNMPSAEPLSKKKDKDQKPLTLDEWRKQNGLA